ncbi:MAG: bifunctional metallophosphatase/5'-nucleotidase [Clostridium sp.]|uniref:bifunctional metallophosphatase/5'-nucleotidase n=1 Tax=Clostridium sp. TaxID=1506 RepID=UPI003D6CCCE0
MKRFFSLVCMVMTIIMILSINRSKVFAGKAEKTMTILFTHDMHDHFLPFNVKQNEEILQLGGYARLQSAINEEKKKDSDLLLVDAGDFSMGTLFQSIYASDAPELRTMGQMGYDVVTLGNHEYDFRANGLAGSLNAAKNSGDKLPQIVQSNVLFPTDKNGKLSATLTNLKQAMDEYGVKDYTIIERGGVKIGVFGLMGTDSASNAPMSEVKFASTVEKAKSVVNILKKEEKVDLVVCLSHSGISINGSESEDETLAKKVPEINLIISGHTHTKLTKPIMVGKTIIGSCGEYSQNLGVINLSQSSNKEWKLDAYKLRQIDNSLPEDTKISGTIDNYKKIVQQKYLNKFDMKFDQVLANSPFNFVATSEIGLVHAEDTLGNLISDAYVYAVKKAEGVNYEPIAVALVPSGTIRGSFVKGNITVADAFISSSLGIGADKVSGYPLISVYLTGKELKTACEVDASISPIMTSAQLYMSGVNFKFNPNRLILNKVTNTTFQKPDGTFEVINDTKLYRAVAGLYSAQMLSVVGEKSFGILSIVPKTKNGAPITDFEAQIITNTANGSETEVKEWLAIAQYLKSFDKVEGVAQIPQYYSQNQARKLVDNNHNVFQLLKNPNGIALVAYTLVIVIITLLTLAIVRIVTRKKRKQRRLAKKNAKKIAKVE